MYLSVYYNRVLSSRLPCKSGNRLEINTNFPNNSHALACTLQTQTHFHVVLSSIGREGFYNKMKIATNYRKQIFHKQCENLFSLYASNEFSSKEQFDN
jgi:hypothetical protein